MNVSELASLKKFNSKPIITLIVLAAFLFFSSSLAFSQCNLIITDPAPVCSPATIDLTDPSITAGSSMGMLFSFWKDSAATRTVNNPSRIYSSGSFYIKGTLDSCSVIKGVTVTIYPLPNLVVHDPGPICSQKIVDLTAPAITEGSQENILLSYWLDQNATIKVGDPTKVANPGTYYIKAVSPEGCSRISLVRVTFIEGTGLVLYTPKSEIVVGCDWRIPVPNPDEIVRCSPCDGTIDVKFRNDSVVENSWGKTIFRTYEATDACGNHATCTQSIMVDVACSICVFPDQPNIELSECSYDNLNLSPEFLSWIGNIGISYSNCVYFQDVAYTIYILGDHLIEGKEYIDVLFYTTDPCSHHCEALGQVILSNSANPNFADRTISENQSNTNFYKPEDYRLEPAGINDISRPTSNHETRYYSINNSNNSINLLWAKSYNLDMGTLGYDDKNNRVHISGRGIAPNRDISILCLDSKGEELWEKSFQNITGWGYPQSIDLDKEGNIFYSGSFGGTFDFDPNPGECLLSENHGNNGYIVKLKPSGEFLLATLIHDNLGYSLNRYGSQTMQFSEYHFYSMKADDNGNTYSTGTFQGVIDFDAETGINLLISDSLWNEEIQGYIRPELPLYDAVTEKKDTSGKFVWARKMGGNNQDRGRSIDVDKNGNVYTLGYFEGTANFDNTGDNPDLMTSVGDYDVYLLKQNSSGYYQWSKQWDVGGINGNRSLAVDSDGNILITGWFSDEVDIDPGSDSEWIQSSGKMDVFVLKLNPTGELIWYYTFGGKEDDLGYAIDVNSRNEVYVAGCFSNSVDFDSGTSEFNLFSGSQDIFILKIEANGEFAWATQFGGSGLQPFPANPGVPRTYWTQDISISADNYGNLYLMAPYTGTIDVDPGPKEYLLSSIGTRNLFVLKIGENSSFLEEKSDIQPFFQVLPTTTSGIFKMEFLSEPGEVHVSVIDVSGKEYLQEVITNHNEMINRAIDLSYCSPGIYFLKLTSATGTFFKKLVVD
jgi:hypothetical protein